MSALIKLSSKLPGDDEVNGLDSLAEQLVDDPEQVVCVLAWLVVPKVTHDVPTGTDVPTVEIRRIEPIGSVAKTPAAVQQLAAELYEARTGRNPLPFEQVLRGRDDLPHAQVVAPNVTVIDEEPF